MLKEDPFDFTVINTNLMGIITRDDIGRYIVQIHLPAEIDESLPK